jgi:hypothetical protein
VQVPAIATSTAGPQNSSASASSSLLGPVAGASTAKKGQLPAFATILAEQSVDGGNGKKEGALLGATEAGNSDVSFEADSTEAAHAGAKPALILPFQEKKNADGIKDNTQSSAPASTKVETKASRHRTTGDTVSSASGKKQNDVATDLAPASGVAAAPALLFVAQAPPLPVPGKWSHVPVRLPASPEPSAPLQYSSRGQKEAPHVQVPGAGSPAFATDEGPLSSPAVSTRALPQPNISHAEGQRTPAPEAPEASNSTPQDLLQAHPSSARAGISPLSSTQGEANRAASSPAEDVFRSVVSPVNSTMAPKLKAQEKTNSEAGRGLAALAPVFSRGIPSMETTRTGADAPTIPSPVRSVDPPDSSTKQAASMPDTNAFQRLDAGEVPATLLHSSAHQIAVGVHDPSLGWLEVQTQSSAGHISATLTAASAEAHANLAAQAPAITQYLADRNVGVHSLNVHTNADAQSGAAGGGQSQSGTGNARQEVPERGGIAVDVSRQPSLSETAEMNAPQAATASYISVRA